MAYGSCASANADYFAPSLVNICNATTFLAFITNLDLAVQRNRVMREEHQRMKSVETPWDEYDFVVIGSGAAGSVVAARLSENPKWNVLLLEAGSLEPAGSEIPSFAGEFLQTDTIWDYSTKNEPIACKSTNGSCPCPSGRNLGGNTVHNGMIYLRGDPADYDNWAAMGNDGWTWEEVKPYFLKSENNGEIDRVGTKDHATGGPLSVERFPYLPSFGFSWLEAASELGYPISEDLNGDQKMGFSWTQSTNKHGVRSSTASAFLRPARNRKNLHVSLNCFVTRVLIENKTAVGVEYYKDGKLKTVYVTKEVIVSGGAMNSPQILLLSGIGPREQLESVGVEVIADLPGVGENFHDHPGTPMMFTIDEPDFYDNDWEAALQYLGSQSGPLSSAGTLSVVGIVSTNSTVSSNPDIEIYMNAYVADCAPGEVGALKSTGKRSLPIVSSYLHPKSRGSVALASNDPFDYPNLQVNYLSDPNDLEKQVEGIKICAAMTEAKILQPYNMTVPGPVEACSEYEYLSDDYWACFAKQDNHALYHFVGSCKMGPVDDPLAVVDPTLKVHGIEGLRVADASIMPQVPSGNTATPTMMIGERAADFIKKYWI